MSDIRSAPLRAIGDHVSILEHASFRLARGESGTIIAAEWVEVKYAQGWVYRVRMDGTWNLDGRVIDQPEFVFNEGDLSHA